MSGESATAVAINEAMRTQVPMEDLLVRLDHGCTLLLIKTSSHSPALSDICRVAPAEPGAIAVWLHCRCTSIRWPRLKPPKSTKVLHS